MIGTLVAIIKAQKVVKEREESITYPFSAVALNKTAKHISSESIRYVHTYLNHIYVHIYIYVYILNQSLQYTPDGYIDRSHAI